MRRVLVVVGDETVAEGLRRALQVFSADWSITSVSSLSDARACLGSGEFEAVVCDAKLPDGDAETLCTELRFSKPAVVRAVVCGTETKPEGAQKLLMVAHQVLRKPIVPAQLFELVERSCQVQVRLGDPRLRAVLGQLGALPALPQTYSRIVEMTADPDCSLDAVATVVESDPSITANVLRIINSAYFGLPRRVASVRETVRYLGIQPLKNIVLTVEVFEGLASGKQARALQQQALSRACAMRELMGRTTLAETAFAAGILCDVGALLLSLRLPLDMRAVENAVSKGADPLEAEHERLGVTHTDIGGALLALWNMPNALVEAVVMHHTPPEVAPPPNVATGLCLVGALEARAGAHPSRRRVLDAVVMRLVEVFPAVKVESLERQFAIAEQAAA